MTRVKMLHSVGDHAAGKTVNLKKDEADRYIALGYAEGELSREFTKEELEELRRGHQEVSV